MLTPQFLGDVLNWRPGDHAVDDVQFLVGQLPQALLDLTRPGRSLMHLLAQAEGFGHRLDERRGSVRFFEDGDRTTMHQVDRLLHIGVSGHHDDRQRAFCEHEELLQLCAVDVGYLQVGNQAPDGIGLDAVEKFTR